MTPHTPTSLTLLERIQTGRSDADWSRFMSIYAPYVHRFIKLDARFTADADDICQNVMQRVVRSLPSFERLRDGSFRNWLKTITVNEVRMYWRTRQRGGAGRTEDDVLDSLADPAGSLSRLWENEHTTHVLRTLQEIIRPEFSERDWTAFELRTFGGLPAGDVSYRLGMTVNQVNIAKSRVLGRLRAEAAGFLEF